MIARIRAFRRALEDGVSERRVGSRYGVGLFVDSLPNVYDLNYLRAERPASAAELAAEADRLMKPFLHRKVVVEDASTGLADDFRSLGWEATKHLVMAHIREPDRRDAGPTVREVELERLAAARSAAAAAEYDDPQLGEQLNEAQRRVGLAVATRWFGILVEDDVAAYCQLRSRGGVAQIEDVNTLARHRGRGFGRAVVQHALDEARPRHAVVFLEALADDWPRELYAKLGFDVVDARWLFLLPPSPPAPPLAP